MAVWDPAVSQLREIWSRMTLAQRAVLGVVVAGLAIGFVVLAFWTGAPEYAVLYARLAPEDAAGVVERLRSEGVSYRLEDGGRTVLVPSNQVYDLRLSLAGEGIPSGGVVGFEIFDKSGFGMTDFAQKVNYTRALEGELTRTIQRLDGVDGARVHLALPERRLFEETAEPATASVVLRLAPGRRLGAKQIQGVVYLVSSSVEGLEPSRVTVVDTQGNVLYQNAGDEPGGLATSQLEYKRSYEKDVEARVRAMLERVLGPGAAVVQVAAYFDFDRVDETSETYDPEAVAVRSEERQTESSSGGTAPAGVPGVASNVGPQAPQGGGAPAGASSRETETVNYEVSKRVTRIQRSQGVLKRLTVAVAVDGTYHEADGGQKEFVPRSDAELAQLRALVEKGVGFDEQRGDAVEVTSIPFRPAEVVPEARTFWRPELYLRLARYGVVVLVALALLLVVVRPVIRWLTRLHPVPELTEPLTVAEMERRIGGGVPEAELEETPPSETVKREALKKKLVETAQTEPSVVAQLLRSWMAED